MPNFGGIFDFDTKLERLAQLNTALEDPSIWQDQQKSQEIGREKKALDNLVGLIQTLSQQIKDSLELFEMAREEADEATLNELDTEAGRLTKEFEDVEFRRMFSGDHDGNNCFVDVQSGSGGTEAQDWASMLLRMYLRYCERKDFAVEVLEETQGEVAGIKSATLKVTGDYA